MMHTPIDAVTYVNNIISNMVIKNPESSLHAKCTPGLRYDAGSCARLAVLIEIAKAYNTSTVIPSDKIILVPNFEVLNPQKYKQYLVNQIETKIGDKCATQKCWQKQNFIRYMDDKARDEFLKYTYRPDSPQGKFEWLSTYDINDTMAQYEKKYVKYKFFGAVPMDFAVLPTLEIGNIDYAKYHNNGITKMGVVFNLDNHDQSGSHWTSMYTDLENGNIFYFDSFGIKPEPRVRALVRQQVKYLTLTGKKMDDIRIDYNKIQHQRGNNACGVYSINFLVRMMRGDDFDKLCNRVIPDNKMNKCRLVYFDNQVHKK